MVVSNIKLQISKFFGYLIISYYCAPILIKKSAYQIEHHILVLKNSKPQI